jgi:subtilisin family serine protease
MSLGGSRSDALNNAALAAGAAGNIVVVAAGNAGNNACYYSPASAGGNALRTGVITVGASAQPTRGATTDAMAYFSNFGSCVDIFAPGVNVLSASNLGRTATRTLSGTSMSTPHVAGVAAVLLERNGFNRSAAVVELLRITTSTLAGLPARTPNRMLQTPRADNAQPSAQPTARPTTRTAGGDESGDSAPPSSTSTPPPTSTFTSSASVMSAASARLLLLASFFVLR